MSTYRSRRTLPGQRKTIHARQRKRHPVQSQKVPQSRGRGPPKVRPLKRAPIRVLITKQAQTWSHRPVPNQNVRGNGEAVYGMKTVKRGRAKDSISYAAHISGQAICVLKMGQMCNQLDVCFPGSRVQLQITPVGKLLIHVVPATRARHFRGHHQCASARKIWRKLWDRTEPGKFSAVSSALPCI